MSDDWPSEKVLRDAASISLVTDRRVLRFLAPFLREEHSLTTAAAVLGKSPSTLAYWVPQLVRAKLIEHRGDVRRAGRAMPRYRATAQAFVVPYRSVPFDRRVALLDGGRYSVMHKLLDGIDEALAQADEFSLKISAPREGGISVVTMESAAQRADQPFTDSWFTIMLDDADAAEFARALEELYERYAHRGGAHKFYAHLGIAREPRHDWRSA
jgi:hypothetical protein